MALACFNADKDSCRETVLYGEVFCGYLKGKGSFISDDETAANAVLQSARQEFIAAVCHAVDLGLSTDEMINLVKQNSAKEENSL